MNSVIGTCSICGGAVTIPHNWCCQFPPTPTCSKCGAQAANHGPVIDMKPATNPISIKDFEYDGFEDRRKKGS